MYRDCNCSLGFLVSSAELELSADEVGEILVLEGVNDLGEIHLNGERAKGVGRRGKIIAERKEGGLDIVARLSGVEVVLNDRNKELADAAELAVQQISTNRGEGHNNAVALLSVGGAGTAVGASELRSNSSILSSADGLSEGSEGIHALYEAIDTKERR